MTRHIFALAVCCVLAYSPLSAQNKSVDQLLTDETVFVWNWTGQQATAESFEQTASYKAYYESGMVPVFVKLRDSIPWTQLVAASGTESPISWNQLKLAWSHVQAHGAAVSIGLHGDNAENARPYGLLIVPQAGPIAPAIENFYHLLENPEETFAGSVPQFDFAGLSLPPIGFPFGAAWQPFGNMVPSGQTSPSPAYLNDGISFFPFDPRIQPVPASSSNKPTPVTPPTFSTPIVPATGSPYQPVSGYGTQVPAVVSPASAVQPWSPDTPAYNELSELRSKPALLPADGIPPTVAAQDSATVEPLQAPRPAPAPTWKIEKTTIGEREIYHLTGVVDPDYTNVHFAWWAEGDDLVVYYGLSPVTVYLESLQNEEHRLSRSELWQTAFDETTVESDHGELTEAARVWLNIERIAQLYADLPIAEEGPVRTIRQLTEPTGLLGLRAIGWRSGYRGQNLVSLTRTVTESPRTGLLSLFEESTFTLADLPPLPANVSLFTARSIDVRKTYREVQNLVEQYFRLAGPEGTLYWELIKQQVQVSSGFDIEKELLAHLGKVVVSYDDSEQEVFGWGSSALAISVTDPEALLNGINRWRDSVNESFQSDIRILKRERRGYTIFALAGRNSYLSPSFAVSGDWLVIGWQPQTVEAFQLRMAGKLPVWSQVALAEQNRGLVPQKFQHLVYSDPRSTVRTMVSLAPWALEAIRWSAGQIAETGFVWNPGVSSLDIPPAELIVEPLYPNLTVTRISDTVIHTERWASSNVDRSAWWLVGGYFALALFAD